MTLRGSRTACVHSGKLIRHHVGMPTGVRLPVLPVAHSRCRHGVRWSLRRTDEAKENVSVGAPCPAAAGPPAQRRPCSEHIDSLPGISQCPEAVLFFFFFFFPPQKDIMAGNRTMMCRPVPLTNDIFQQYKTRVSPFFLLLKMRKESNVKSTHKSYAGVRKNNSKHGWLVHFHAQGETVPNVCGGTKVSPKS